MEEEILKRWRHQHSFGQDQKRPGEFRTLLVITITASMMIVEIAAGIAFGSMALLADGLHMGSHAVALSINAFAYVYARRHAHNERYSFGTGKINTLGGYTGAILLAVFATMMAFESITRLIEPVEIAFNQAIFVAVVGLVVNGASVLILGLDHGHNHDHHHHDHNLKSAYLHVLADALTSFLAIFALLIGKYFGAIWMDPLMGIVGAILVARWSFGLLKTTSTIILDEQASADTCNSIQLAIESEESSKIVDLHVWTIGPGIYSAVISIVSNNPQQPAYYKSRIAEYIKLQHVSVEVNAYDEQSSCFD
jgi:cation diffusion facilitator family transporter